MQSRQKTIVGSNKVKKDKKDSLSEKLEGTIKTLIRNRNSKGKPVYFKIQPKSEKGDAKVKFGTIECFSRTQRYFQLPDIKMENARIVILDINEQENWWQQIGIFVTYP